ncbi:MAG: hypothetical protein QME60_05140 [Verrucomicrobiota bacterium]|nr:hypothetical protein [Verrucomicrobiota bacterium]
MFPDIGVGQAGAQPSVEQRGLLGKQYLFEEFLNERRKDSVCASDLARALDLLPIERNRRESVLKQREFHLHLLDQFAGDELPG